MFTQANAENARRERWVRIGSIAVHCLLLVWLLRSPEALLLQLNSVARGQNGTSVTRLYWPSKSVDSSTHSSPDTATEKYRHQRLGHEKLAWKKPVELAKVVASATPVTHTEIEDNYKTQTLSALGHGAQAGARYGTLNQGSIFGDEIRPALPTSTSDPVVYPWQLPNSPGNEVIEITIDERGEIVHRAVLVSLGSEIDEKCLAALENWHFHPATRNGAPIPSKQDAIFPFKARG